MGTFKCKLRLESLAGGPALTTEALVDTGAAFTVVPAAKLAEIGVEPTDTVWLSLANGHRAEYPLGRAAATVQGRTEATLVVFGEDDNITLLGAYTLEGLRFAVDPNEGRLIQFEGTM